MMKRLFESYELVLAHPRFGERHFFVAIFVPPGILSLVPGNMTPSPNLPSLH